MPTNSYPNATNSNSGFSITGAATVHAAINDAPGSSGSDSDYIYGSEAGCSVAIATPSDPGTSTGWKLILRNKHDGTGLNSSLMTVRLKVGGSTVKTWSPSISTSFTYREVILSSGEADAVRANLSDIDIEVDVEPIGVDGANGYLSALALQAPDGTVTKAGSDTLNVSVAESKTLQSDLSRSDTLSVSFSESGAIASDLSRSDTVDVSVDEAAAILSRSEVSDTLDVALEETSENLIRIDVTDDLHVVAGNETLSELFATLDVSDPIDVSVEETAEIFVRVEVSDTLDVALDDQQETTLRSEVTDDLDVALEEGDPVELLSRVAVSDDLDVVLVFDASSVFSTTEFTDTLNVVLDLSGDLRIYEGVPNACSSDYAYEKAESSDRLVEAAVTSDTALVFSAYSSDRAEASATASDRARATASSSDRPEPC